MNIDELNKWIEEQLANRNAEIKRKIISSELVPGPINPYTGEVSARWCLKNTGPFNPGPDIYSVE